MNKKNYFYQLIGWAVAKHGLQGHELNIFIQIYSQTIDSDYMVLTRSQIAKALSISTVTAGKCVNSLIKKGKITREMVITETGTEPRFKSNVEFNFNTEK